MQRGALEMCAGTTVGIGSTAQNGRQDAEIRLCRLYHLAGVEGAFLAGEALHDYFGIFIDEYCHFRFVIFSSKI